VESGTILSQEPEVKKVVERSAAVFKATVTILGSGAVATVLAAVFNPTADKQSAIVFGLMALLMGSLGALAGALVNWGTVLTRVRLLFYAQLIALFGLIGCLGLAAASFVLAPGDPPPPYANPAVVASG